MAATYGRLTGKPGVCIATLGPGALNFSTGAAYALLGAMPMIMITGQKGILSSRQARFQVVDIVGGDAAADQAVAPDRLAGDDSDAGARRVPRRAGGAARSGPSRASRRHRPRDVRAGADGAAAPVELPVANAAALDRAAEMILQAERPLLMLGAAASRPRSTSDLAQFVLRTRIPYFTTQMGKGTVPGGTDLYMGTAALSERDYVHEAIERADLIITIGHDTVEKPPFIMGANGPKVIHVGYQPAHVEQVYFPQAEIVGDLGPSLRLLADRIEGKIPHAEALLPLREGILSRIADRATEDRADAAAPGARCPQRHAAGRHRRPGQRHVQDLVRAKLPHPGRQHAVAGQCAGDDGRRASLRDDGGAALPESARHGRLRRRRLHDEQPGAGDGGAGSSSTSSS